MKKFVVFLITLLFVYSVHADGYDYKTINYTVVIDGESYAATVKYWDLYSNGIVSEDDPYRFSIDYDSIVLTDSSGTNYTYDSTMGMNDYRIINTYKFCDFITDNSNIPYICNEERNKTEFSLEEINDEDYISNFLPKFIKYNNDLYVGHNAAFLTYIADERGLTNEEINLFKNEFNSFVEGNNKEYEFQDNFRYNSTIDVNFSNANEVDVVNNNLSKSAYLQIALEIKNLLNKATDVNVCTEDDLNAIRSQRNVSFLNLDVEFDASLSSACYNVLFGNGLGNGNLYSKTREAFSYANDKGGYRSDKNKLIMSYYFFESYYEKGFAFLTGETMQVEVEEVVRCSIFGEKTVEIFQYGFNIMKYAGLIVGTLLCIVDVFKAVVQKDADGKKQLSVMMKRILAVVLLILTPILVEIIFNFISTIGVDDPICGIR